MEQDKIKYGENNNTVIITVSGNWNNMGIVMNSNNEVANVLGYTKNDICNQNINRIQPKCYADYHDEIVREYLERAESKSVGVERLVFPQSKSGYIISCNLMIKVLFT